MGFYGGQSFAKRLLGKPDPKCWQTSHGQTMDMVCHLWKKLLGWTILSNYPRTRIGRMLCVCVCSSRPTCGSKFCESADIDHSDFFAIGNMGVDRYPKWVIICRYLQNVADLGWEANETRIASCESPSFIVDGCGGRFLYLWSLRQPVRNRRVALGFWLNLWHICIYLYIHTQLCIHMYI